MAFRTYSAEFGPGAQTFYYIKDLYQGASGVWRPAQSTEPATKICSVSFASSLLVKSGIGELYTVGGYNSGLSQFLKVYDGTGVNGALSYVASVPGTGNFAVEFSSRGMAVTGGIFVQFSNTTTGNSNPSPDCLFTATYK